MVETPQLVENPGPGPLPPQQSAVYPLQFRGGLPGIIPSSDQELFSILMKQGDTFPMGFVGSLVGCQVAPADGNYVISFKRNGVEVATATIETGNTTGTFDGPLIELVFNEGDVFGCILPTADSALVGPQYTLIGIHY